MLDREARQVVLVLLALLVLLLDADAFFETLLLDLARDVLVVGREPRPVDERREEAPDAVGEEAQAELRLVEVVRRLEEGARRGRDAVEQAAVGRETSQRSAGRAGRACGC